MLKAKSGVLTYTVSNIEWDTDGELFDVVKLPKKIKVTIPSDVQGYEDIENYISDEISKITGYCHKGFTTTPKIPT